MCLNIIKDHATKKTNIANLKVAKYGYVYLWKVFDVDKNNNLISQFYDYHFNKGKNTAKGTVILSAKYASSLQYTPGFHCFITEEEANLWKKHISGGHEGGTGEKTVVRIKVKKSWITTIGSQFVTIRTTVRPRDKYLQVAVCKHIFI